MWTYHIIEKTFDLDSQYESLVCFLKMRAKQEKNE